MIRWRLFKYLTGFAPLSLGLNGNPLTLRGSLVVIERRFCSRQAATKTHTKKQTLYSFLSVSPSRLLTVFAPCLGWTRNPLSLHGSVVVIERRFCSRQAATKTRTKKPTLYSFLNVSPSRLLTVFAPCLGWTRNPLSLHGSVVVIERRFCSRQAATKTHTKKQTLYSILNVSPSATRTEIKEAYYELSFKLHPDRNRDLEDGERFAELTQAYKVLNNITSRREYDKEIGTYYLIRSSPKKRGGEKVLRLTDDVMEIEMGDIEEPGTFLSNIVSLSAILGEAVRVKNIHVTKGSHGVQSHELRMLYLLRQACNGTLVAHKGATAVTFIPGDLQEGMLKAEAGRLGRLSLLIEAVLPCLAFAPKPLYSKLNTVHLAGSTHSVKGLHIDYIHNVYRHFLHRFGFDFNCDIRRRSFRPMWDGKVVLQTLPVSSIKPVQLTEQGQVIKISGWAFVAGQKPMRVAQMMAKSATTFLKKKFQGIPVEIDSTRHPDNRAEGTGQGILILAETSSGILLSGTALWKRGLSLEDVVSRALRMLIHSIDSGACVDEFLQDQAVLYMALAKGRSVIKTTRVTPRTKAAIFAVESMCKLKFTISPVHQKTASSYQEGFLLECNGMGLINESDAST